MVAKLRNYHFPFSQIRISFICLQSTRFRETELYHGNMEAKIVRKPSKTHIYFIEFQLMNLCIRNIKIQHSFKIRMIYIVDTR